MKIKYKMIILIAAIVMTLTMSKNVKAASEIVNFLDYYANNKLRQPWVDPNNNEIIESIEDRKIRIKMILDVTVEESTVAVHEYGWFWSDVDLATAAFIKMWNESRGFDYKVHAGIIKGDNGKSICLGQIMNGSKNLAGVDRNSTKRCVHEVMRHLVFHQKRCLNEKIQPSQWSMAKIYAGYGTGWACKENIWMPVKDNNGNIKLDKNGNPEKIYWARQRSYAWWKMRTAMKQAREAWQAMKHN